MGAISYQKEVRFLEQFPMVWELNFNPPYFFAASWKTPTPQLLEISEPTSP
jgi:hypothetical protein